MISTIVSEIDDIDEDIVDSKDVKTLENDSLEVVGFVIYIWDEFIVELNVADDIADLIHSTF
ncbi:unnamed protein product, partial [Rotaria magnacalcarata]